LIDEVEANEKGGVGGHRTEPAGTKARHEHSNSRGALDLMNTELPDFSRALPSEDHRACLGLGSNVDPEWNLRRAIRTLRRAIAVEAVSTAWESPAVGGDGPDYINAALLVRTAQSKEWLMARLKEIEDQLGRVRNPRRPARLTIDIDLLVFDREFFEDDLWTQAYRAVPVAELLPDLCCPSTGETLSHLANRLATSSPIKPRPEILAGSPQAGTSRPNPTFPTWTRTP
jgi:2-amino-4-hydroxy-6-hydroxymethyldihydropteridine diphosphokinase